MAYEGNGSALQRPAPGGVELWYSKRGALLYGHGSPALVGTLAPTIPGCVSLFVEVEVGWCAWSFVRALVSRVSLF